MPRQPNHNRRQYGHGVDQVEENAKGSINLRAFYGAALILALATATASYYVVEQPFNSLRVRFK